MQSFPIKKLENRLGEKDNQIKDYERRQQHHISFHHKKMLLHPEPKVRGPTSLATNNSRNVRLQFQFQ